MRIRLIKAEPDPVKSKKILIVEDEQDIADLLHLHLKDLADSVEVALDGHEGMRLAL